MVHCPLLHFRCLAFIFFFFFPLVVEGSSIFFFFNTVPSHSLLGPFIQYLFLLIQCKCHSFHCDLSKLILALFVRRWTINTHCGAYFGPIMLLKLERIFACVAEWLDLGWKYYELRFESRVRFHWCLFNSSVRN